MQAPLAVFRCDASPSIGAGHVSRCLAFAEALSEVGWDIRFVVTAETVKTVPALTVSGFDIRALAKSECELRALRSDTSGQVALVVVDHYQRGRQFETKCRGFASRILAFDDASGRDHNCDVLLDAGASDASIYAGHVPTHASVLAGPAHALTRRSFRLRRGEALARRDGRPVKSILVCCGATDPMNCTEAVLEALPDIASDITITIALSSRAPHLEAVRRRLQVNMRLQLDADNLAELMTEAELAIGAPGVMAFERAVLGLPSILVTFADNQRGVARIMTNAGAVLDAGGLDSKFVACLKGLLKRAVEDSEARRHMAQAASALIDGRGAMRVMLALQAETSIRGDAITLRLAAPEDEAWLLSLQSEPQTRRYFRNPSAPSAAEHHAWIQRTLSDSNRLLLIIEADGRATGTLRLDRQPETNREQKFEISIAVDPAHRGRGIGAAALRVARKLMPNAVFDAQVHLQNAASKALFRSVGFVEVSNELYRSVPG
jgi:UDP-2,4-diacetamido-2,4,6-trideoxy-beta-L-altropyranose hydrolase